MPYWFTARDLKPDFVSALPIDDGKAMRFHYIDIKAEPPSCSNFVRRQGFLSSIAA
ncbi:hypothetical protein R2A130_3523 [Ahrensia sp. R2A130]|nr:hypothetical protein R2A130_3523 [Ahrensia sp. R2A130]